MPERQYLCIDQKSYYASVECVMRGLDPMTTNLVVADPDRSQNTICLAVSPSLKALGVKNRCRIREIPPYINVIIAKPRMKLYIECAAAIHGVFLRYIAPFDIHVYSVDESFMDVTPYLRTYKMTAKQLALTMMQDVRRTIGTICTCGIGTNLYLAKVALDIKAKHAKDFVGILDEESYRTELWDHKPITDFWHVAGGTQEKLKRRGITTMRGVAQCDEDMLYKWFGVDYEILYDHAWGREPTTIEDIKNYVSKSKSLSSGQTLMHDYHYQEGLTVAKEMVAQLCLDMTAKKLATKSISLYVGYSYTEGIPGVGDTAKITVVTNLAMLLIPAVEAMFRRIVNPGYVIRRICICCNNVVTDEGVLQLNMFENVEKQIKYKDLQDTMICIQSKYGKNAIFRGINLEPAATGLERNMQIGGHHQ